MGDISNVRRLYEDAGRDVTDTYSAFQKWGEIYAKDADFISRFANAKRDSAQRAAFCWKCPELFDIWFGLSGGLR